MYIIKRFNKITCEWDYMNYYKTYSEACEALEWLKTRFNDTYEIFPVEI